MKTNFKILLVEDMDSFRGAVSQLLGVYNDIQEAKDLASARKALSQTSFDVVVLDKGLPDGDGIELISEIKEINPNSVVIMLTSDSDFSSIRHCMSKGADDYVTKSENTVPDLLVRIPVAVAKAASSRKLKSLEELAKTAFKYEIVGKSVPTMSLRETIASLKGTEAHVLITGESGTGKELVARRLNAIEDDNNRPFVAINCGAIPENLLESELFGHKKGSFTGAVQDQYGKFELAHNGDLFLDEVGELSQPAQVKLLRVIQEGEFTRVGDSKNIKVKCRIIAATNKDLETMVKEGRFREDLFHRLNVVRIYTSPLRARMEDISDLAKSLVFQVAGANFKIADHAIRALQNYDWPGNIRELRNAIERAVILARRRGASQITYDDVKITDPKVDIAYRTRKLIAALPEKEGDLTPKRFKEFMVTMETEYYKAALEAANGSAIELANRIGIGRSTAFKRLKKLGISTKDRESDVSRPAIKFREHSEDRLLI